MCVSRIFVCTVLIGLGACRGGGSDLPTDSRVRLGASKQAATVNLGTLIGTVVGVGDVVSSMKSSSASTGLAVANKINSLAPDVVVGLGDMQYNATAQDSLLNTAWAPLLGAKVGVSTFAVPGNHDYVNGGTANFNYIFPNHFCKHLGSWIIVGVDSGPNGTTNDTTYFNSCVGTQMGHIVAAIHYPPRGSGNITCAPGYARNPTYTAFNAHKVDVVLAGHDHDFELIPKGTDTFVTAIAGTGGYGLVGLPVCCPLIPGSWFLGRATRPSGCTTTGTMVFGFAKLQLGSSGFKVDFIGTSGSLLHSSAFTAN